MHQHPLPRNGPRISQCLANDLQPYNAMDQMEPNISSHGVITPVTELQMAQL
jgi:hypothetical protein